MKTIGNQPKYPKYLQLPVFLKMGITNCRYSICMQLQKEQQIHNKQKKSVNICQKTLSKPSSQFLALKICSIAHSLNTNKVL